MSQPIARQSVVDATGATEGSDVNSLGHYMVSLFVSASDFDGGSDTVEVVLEGSPDRARWDTIATVTESDLTSDPTSGESTGSEYVDGAYYPYLRARVVSLSDSAGSDMSVSAWVCAAANSGQGRAATERRGKVDI